MRIYELAKELGIDSKELIEKLKRLNFPVKSHMSSVDAETAEIIKHEIEELKKKEIEENVVEVDFPISVKDLAIKLNKKPSEVLQALIKEGKFYTINQNLSEEEARAIAYKYKVNLKRKPTKEEEILKVESKDLRKRAPIVTLMGHIDHGKTSLLDYIRKSRITERETGGITQHIGAYQVSVDKADSQLKKITFLDTPGHETFTAMRARGANITDIVVLVVAADEGVKPQTVEAVDHAKVAEVPIIVAINKIDKPNADIDMVKQQLSKIGLVPEDWGGKTTTIGVSAKTGEGVDELLELILLQAEIMDLKADYSRPAIGTVVEARLSKGKGPLATVLIKEGTLRIGDWCVCGLFLGRIRAMFDDRGNMIAEAPPSCPCEILGLNGVPNPGDQLLVVPDEKSAKEIIEKRKEEIEKKKLFRPSHMKLEDLYRKVKEKEIKQLKIILKADVGGTLEAVEQALGKISTEEVELAIVHKGVGSVNSSDVLLAEVSDAIIVGFKVAVDSKAREYARQKGIEIRLYQIVYELIDDIKSALEGMLAPKIRRVFLGRAKVKAVFKLSKAGIVAGCQVIKGKVIRGAFVQLLRDNEVIFEGKIQSLKRFKDDVRQVEEGLECGISIGFNNIKEGDVLDIFSEEVITRQLK
jgi:translation initiation factor IF-2